MPPPIETPFRYVGGDPALDFVNTVDWTEHGLVHERLSDYAQLVRWAEGAGVIGVADARELRKAASRHPDEAGRAFRSALRVREAMQLLAKGLAAPKSVAPAEVKAALELLNASLRNSLARLQLEPGARGMSLSWRGFGSELESPIWAVVWSAARLLASEEVDKLRICAGENCGWVYVDRSRNGLRRWCEMATCGTLRKTERRRARRHAAR
ncbi:MAG TPA: ABATE domain-containing protein [Gemmatimonadaceae bacterium]|jgi:predicted RNA-binding Zn ribbon-like protein